MKTRNISTRDRKKAIRQLILGQAQIISATVALYFLLTTGLTRQTCLSLAVGLLFTLLSLSFKLYNQ